MEPITLAKAQQEFETAVLNGENVFLTGKAGTGKSFIVRHVMSRLKAMKMKVMAVAPTGIAANNIEGQTIHSAFVLSPYGVLSPDECKYMRGERRELFKKVDVLVIDEVSMMRPDILDAMHWTLKKNGLKGLDRRQIIFIGDLKQLPNVLNDNTRSVLLSKYDGDTFLAAHILKKIQWRMIELDEPQRQKDPEFIENLNIIRDGGKSAYFRQFVHTKPKGVILCPYNQTVQEYNERGLNSQVGEVFTFTAKIEGMVKPEDFNLEHIVKVKNGCKIMYLVNSKENPLRNGTIGTFVSHNGCHFIRVNETDFAIEPVSVTKKEYVYDKEKDELVLEELGEITQVPIKLAYALSIHKSQGMTFSEVTVDLTRPCFAPGQMYVALSRVTGPEGLRIIH